MSEYLDQMARDQAKLAELAGVGASADLYQKSGFASGPPWIYPPDNFQGFDSANSILTPAVGAGDTVVLSFKVPFGWDGVIRRLSHNYAGGGFLQGSGAIIWRLRINGQIVRNYDAITMEWGTIQQPRLIDGIRIYSSQLVEYLVTVPGGSGFIPSQSTFILCSLGGWIYPRGLA